MTHRMESMLPDIIAVVVISLVKPHHGKDLRPEDANDFRICPQDLHCMSTAEELKELCLDPFRGNASEQLPVLADTSPRFFLNGKAQDRGKPQSPQNTQRVFLKTAVRIPHCPQDLIVQVCLSMKGIPKFSPQVHCHGIDCEIPAAQILLQRLGKGNTIRPAVVMVISVQAVSGDLYTGPIYFYRNCSVLQSARQCGITKDRHRLFRQRTGRYIPISRDESHQAIPYTTSHAPGFIAPFLQPCQQSPHIFGYLHPSFTPIPVAILFILHYNIYS